jgi:hypothetical protein
MQPTPMGFETVRIIKEVIFSVIPDILSAISGQLGEDLEVIFVHQPSMLMIVHRASQDLETMLCVL